MSTRSAPHPADDLQERIEDRIRQMESPAHRFPTRFSRKDWWLTVLSALFCLAAVVAGAFL